MKLYQSLFIVLILVITMSKSSVEQRPGTDSSDEADQNDPRSDPSEQDMTDIDNDNPTTEPNSPMPSSSSSATTSECDMNTKKRNRTPRPVDPNIYELLVDSLRPGGSSHKDNPDWYKITRRLRKWTFLLKEVTNPVTGQSEERVVFCQSENGASVELILLKTTEIDKVLSKYYDDSMGEGAKKLLYRISQNFVGLNEKGIQKWLNNRQVVQQSRPVFTNKAPLLPIKAQHVMERNQIDLVDMRGRQDTFDGKTYNYILSVIDVFSRYVFLRPLTTKSAQDIADILAELYCEIGPPKILQSDQGSEFKGAVRELMSLLGVKVICSSPFTPQSQGKCERSHPTWKSKIRLQLDELCSDSSYHWSQNLHMINRCYNDGLHSSLGMTPFEVFYGRKSNRECNLLVIGQTIPSQQIELEEEDIEDQEVDAANTLYEEACIDDIERNDDLVKNIRTQAKIMNDKEAQKMIKRNVKRNPPSRYFVGEKVFLRVKNPKGINRGGHSLAKPLVHLATILDVYPDAFRYKVQYEEADGNVIKNVPVSELTSVTRADEQRRQKIAKKGSRKTKNRSKISKNSDKSGSNLLKQTNYNMSNPAEILRFCSDIALGIRLSLKKSSTTNQQNLDRHVEAAGLQYREPRTPADGNCLFHALADQLQLAGMAQVSHIELRSQLVQYLAENEETANGVHMLGFTGYDTWEDYLQYMRQDATWGDEIILIAAASKFNVQLTIISSLPSRDVIIIEPENSAPHNVPTLLLGHLAELHYFSLTNTSPPQNNSENSSNFNKRKRKHRGESHSKKHKVDSCVNDMVTLIPTLSRNELLDQIEVPIDGFYNNEYTQNDTLDTTNHALLGFSDMAHYYAALLRDSDGITIPIRNGHYYLTNALMDDFCSFQESQRQDQKKENYGVLYIDMVLIYWLYKRGKLHYLEEKASGRFLYIPSSDAENFNEFKEQLLEELWQNKKENQGPGGSEI